MRVKDLESQKQERRIYRVRWPNGEVELIFARNDEELYEMIEEEALENKDFLPFDAEVEEVELTESIKISLRNRLRTLGDLMRLPAKRKLDIEQIMIEMYKASEEETVYLH